MFLLLFLYYFLMRGVACEQLIRRKLICNTSRKRFEYMVFEKKKRKMFFCLWAESIHTIKTTADIDHKIKIDIILKIGNRSIPVQVKAWGGLLK